MKLRKVERSEIKMDPILNDEKEEKKGGNHKLCRRS